ncbi:MAG: zinc ABC transporter substrate-binding protein [Planctomycetota bacterium]
MFRRSGILFVLLVAAGCSETASSDRLSIVATTGHIHDALVRITKGAEADLKLLCGPGVDPHSYSASTRDVQAIDRASAIFYNGFHLEAKLHDLLHGDKYGGKAWAMASAFPNESRLDWIEDGAIDPAAPYDPHIWNHLPGWAACVEALAGRLAEIDPDHAELYKTNGRAYAEEIRNAHTWASTELAKIPVDRRLLVSAHDAFNYFAGAYGLETVAVLGVGNDPEADIKTMQSVSAVISARKVPVIFMESMTNPKVTEALQEACTARGWPVSISTDPLYSDDLGDSAPQDTYLGAFRSNVEVIREQLGSASG